MSDNKIIINTIVNIQNNSAYWIFKRIFDIVMCFLLLPLLIFFTALFFFLNIFFNKGSIYYVQKRMGKNCEPFLAIKFRTMKNIDTIARKYLDPLEVDRITTLGRLMRKTKIDELPQILNVLKGDMSLIGPRPDYYEHALSFLKYVPSYRCRHLIRPGISGLSQIRLGYAEGLSATKKKSKVDLFYIKNASIKLDMKIFFGTLLAIFNAFRN
jgi:lipopolysaccharide/colanic/teichoic acid biosynthesis glycosyltransferase